MWRRLAHPLWCQHPLVFWMNLTFVGEPNNIQSRHEFHMQAAASSHEFHMQTRRKAQCQWTYFIETWSCEQFVWTFAVSARIIVDRYTSVSTWSFWFIIHDICSSCLSLTRTSLLACAFSNGATTPVSLTAKCQRWQVIHVAHIKPVCVVHDFNDACEHVSHKPHCIMCIVCHSQHSMSTHSMGILKQTCATSHDAQHKCSGQTVMFDYLLPFPGWTFATNLNGSDLYNCSLLNSVSTLQDCITQKSFSSILEHGQWAGSHLRCCQPCGHEKLYACVATVHLAVCIVIIIFVLQNAI